VASLGRFVMRSASGPDVSGKQAKGGWRKRMETFEFKIVTSGLDAAADKFEDRFFEAGCDDATIAVTNGVITLHFARQANDLAEAIASARACVIRAGAEVKEVSPTFDKKPRKPIDLEMLKRAAAEMPFQTESAGDFIRRMRDSNRY
jgi:hypothetical protein